MIQFLVLRHENVQSRSQQTRVEGVADENRRNATKVSGKQIVLFAYTQSSTKAYLLLTALERRLRNASSAPQKGCRAGKHPRPRLLLVSLPWRAVVLLLLAAGYRHGATTWTRRC